MMNTQSLQKKMERKQKKMDAGLVSEKYPRVSGMVIQMTYYRKLTNPVLMERTLNVFPESYAYFHMRCKDKSCSGGGFDLTPVIKGLVKDGKRSGKGTLVCPGKGSDLPAEHASISYDISIKYNG